MNPKLPAMLCAELDGIDSDTDRARRAAARGAMDEERTMDNNGLPKARSWHGTMFHPTRGQTLKTSLEHGCPRCAELYEALSAIAKALDGKRNRFGKLEGYTTDREPLRLLAVRYGTPGAIDNIEQAVHVARAVLAKVSA